MNKVVQIVEMLRQKLPGLRRHSLKETPTRTIIVDPLLEALGWDVRDPDEVQLEYPTVDGKSVDYALKLNKKVILLVEAKAIDDGLGDVKAITQVVGYAANDGIVWCILTNGVKWRVYRSVEKCPAPEKLMFEVSIDSDASEGMTVAQIAKQMWRFSRDEMAKGTLDSLGEQTFTDGKVRKAVQTLMSDPPKPLLNLVRQVLRDDTVMPQRIKESLVRIAGESATAGSYIENAASSTSVPKVLDAEFRSRSAKKAWQSRRAKKGDSPYSEDHHIAGKPQEAVQLYRAVDRLCFSFAPSDVSRHYWAKCVSYEHGKEIFCSVHVLQGGLRVWLKLKYAHITNPPSFARDVSNVGHWGSGDVELRISNRSELDAATDLIRQSFDAIKK